MDKRFLALIVTVSLIGTATASAQSPETRPDPKDKVEFDAHGQGPRHPGAPHAGRPGHSVPHEKFGPGRGQQHHFTPEETAAREASFMKREYKLSEKQYKKVFEILRDKAAVRKDVRDGKITREKGRQKLNALDKKMKRVLTKEQYKKWESRRPQRLNPEEIAPDKIEEIVK